MPLTTKLRLFLAQLVVLVPCISLSPAAETDSATATQPGVVTDRYVRIQRDNEGQVTALQTAIASFKPKGDAASDVPQVDLIGAIHVGDKSYFQSLNEAFQKYDVVLYELVAEADERPEPGSRSAHPVSMMQVGMKNLLGLAFQLDIIDYTALNLIHADLSPDEFAESMSDRGESLSQMFFRMMGQSMAIQSRDPARSSDARLLAAIFSRNRARELKRVMAEQFEDSLAVPSVLNGPDGSTIITVRNRRALDVLEKQLQAGKKKVGIFYGAAHMPDMEEQLRDRFELELRKTRWVTAWSMGQE